MDSMQFEKYRKTKYRKLAVAIAIDLIGNSSYFLPVLGDIGDGVWGAISALLILALFPKYKFMAGIGFAEEVLPVTDIVPTACIAWYMEYGRKENNLNED